MVAEPSPASLRQRYEYSPWLFWEEAPPELREEQLEYQRSLAATGVITIGQRCYVAPSAVLDPPESLVIGDRSFIAAHTQVMGEIIMGRDCSVNAYADVRGRVTLGDGVRIGAHASLLAFNHEMDPGSPIHTQPVTTEGIIIGADVWIGSHVVVLDGVTVGAHSVLGAGAIVTRDVAPWSIVGGNPARPIRDRRVRGGAHVGKRWGPELEAFAQQVNSECRDVLDRSWVADAGAFVDQPGEQPTIRAWCDAVEIAAMFAGEPRLRVAREDIAAYLGSLQHPVTGLLPPAHGRPEPAWEAIPMGELDSAYSVLCVGYALGLLGSRLLRPIAALTETPTEALVRHLDDLPWAREAWRVGAWVDTWGSALTWEAPTNQSRASLAALLGWLVTECDPISGMWGEWSPDEGRLQLVNGFYRVVRGTFAQLGVPVPYPEPVIDTVLAHVKDARYFRDDRGSACNVLDASHALWLCGRQTTYRGREVTEWAAWQLGRVLSRWRPREGFSFELEEGPSADHRPGLQGTEMWLSTLWLLADLLGLSHRLGFAPRGIHRPEPLARVRRRADDGGDHAA